MALIFSPLTEDALEGPYKPIPKGVFVMLQLGEGTSQLESDMDKVVASVLKQRKFKPIKATSQRSQKDYLVKIIQLIRGCGVGVAIFSEFTPAPTLANIFFEVALCNLLGKPVILVKSAQAKAPSDFVRTEWVSYVGGKEEQLRKDFSKSLSSVLGLAEFYETLGDLAVEAEEVDLELAFERYKQAFLIDGGKASKRKIHAVLERLKTDDDPAARMRPVRSRLRKSVAEFCKLLG